MNETEIRRYAALMKELDLTGLEITEDSRVVRLERTASAQIQTISVPEAAAPVSRMPESFDCISVKSPVVGLFYAAPAENAEPYIVPGDRVTKGQTLCIVEAMKLMNEISAEEDGIVEKVCVTNGQLVEYGTELFRIRRLA